MDPFALGLEAIPDLVANRFFRHENARWIDAKAGFLEGQAKRLTQASHVFSERRSRASSRYRFPRHIRSVALAKRISAEAKLDLPRALRQSGMTRKKVEDDPESE